MAEMALNKIMIVSSSAPPAIRDQAIEYREKLKEVLVFYMNKMAENERTTILALLNQQGQGDMAEIIRRL
jgi:ribosomal protein L30E